MLGTLSFSVDATTDVIPRSQGGSFQYGYDRNNNRLFRDNLINNDFDELYHSGAGYDGLNQMVAFSRGALNSKRDSVSSPFCSQTWSLDAMGNWSNFGACTGSQTRTHNRQNQTTAVGSNNLAFDNNGNTLTDETGKQYVYDAWNRLVKVKNLGGTLLISYTYDALGRRVQEAINGGTTRDLYYSDQWQVLEDKVSSGSGTSQYVWSPVYVDAMVLRDRDTNSDSTLDERLYLQQDANFNTTALLSTAGAVVERYAYDPYGRFTDRDGIDTATLDANWGERGASSYAWVYLHQGGRYDNSSGLYHFRHREHSPTLGRWLQVDPIRYEAGDWNLYRFVANRPVSLVDPLGLKTAPPPCPAARPGIKNPAGGWDETPGDGWCLDDSPWGTHKGADVCYRSYGHPGSGGAQCCYEANGNLIPEGQPGSGTEDVVGPAEGEEADGTCNWDTICVLGHFICDVLPSIPKPWIPHQPPNVERPWLSPGIDHPIPIYLK
jgi:RHS repeat-associated protein